MRAWLQAHPPGHNRQQVYDFFVAYFVPRRVWVAWRRWYWKVGN